MLRVIPISGGSSAKADAIVSAFPGIWGGTVLDLGCRTRELGRALPSTCSYVGMDIAPSGHVIATLEAPLPFTNDGADVVVASDVLEHVDDIYLAFAEMCRVASRYCVVTLPNMYELRLRLNHMMGRPVSGKYGLPPERPADRHRWFFSLEEARRFCRERAVAETWQLVDEGCLMGFRRSQLGRLVTARSALMAATYVALLAPRDIASAWRNVSPYVGSP